MSEAIQIPLDPADEPLGHDRLVLLANSSMRARRRPLAISLMWAWDVAFGILIAWPFSSVARAAYGHDPQGDARLWTPGGLELMDLLVHTDHARPALLTHAGLLLAVAAVLGILPMAAMVASIAYTTPDLRSPPLRKVLGRAADAFRPLLGLAVLLTLIEGGIAIGGLLLAGGISSSLASRLGDARAQQIGWMAAAVFLGLACVAGVVHDLARVAVIRFRVGGMRALRLAFNSVRRRPIATVWSWTWRSSAACVPIVIGAVVASKLGGRGGGALLALAAIHQLVVLTRTALRASWLAKALRLVDRAHRVLKVTPPHAPAATVD